LSNNSKAVRQAADQKLLTGIDNNVTGTLTVAGTKYTAAQLAAVLQGRIDARNATDVAKATYQKTVAAEAAQVAGSKVLLARTKTVLLAMYAGSPEVLAAMGLSERKSPVKTVEVKAAALVKSEATRLARHTTGPKAKLKITGVSAAQAAAAPVTPVAPGGTGHS
jgi:hypothetical protein